MASDEDIRAAYRDVFGQEITEDWLATQRPVGLDRAGFTAAYQGWEDADIRNAYKNVFGRDVTDEWLATQRPSNLGIAGLTSAYQGWKNDEAVQAEYNRNLATQQEQERQKALAEQTRQLVLQTQQAAWSEEKKRQEMEAAQRIRVEAEQQRQAEAAKKVEAAAPQAQSKAPAGKYSIKEFQTGSGGDAGYNTEYALVDPDGNAVAGLVPQYDNDGGIIGYGALIGGSGDSGSDSVVPIDIDAINAKAAKGNVPFGTGMGPALGYEYGMKNSEGDIFRKFDAQGNLTEYLDQHGVFQNASDFKPTGLQFNPMTGNLETAYSSPNSKRVNITESNATSVNPYHEDQGGWLGEGGWKNIGMLALTGLTAGLGAAGGVGLAGAAGANVAESAAAINALLQGGSTLGNALQIGNQLVNIGTTAYEFLKDSNPETAYIIEQLQAETKKNEDAGMTRDQAVETAMGTIAETAPTPSDLPSTSSDKLFDNDIENLVKDVGEVVNPSPATTETTTTDTGDTTEAQADEVDPIATPLINELTTRVERYQAEGKSRDDAIAQSILDLSNSSTANKAELISLITSGDQGLMDALGETTEDLTSQLTNLGTDLGGQITGVKTDLTNLGTDLGGQITTVRDDLTGEITGVRDDLTGQITDVKTDLGGQITGVGDQVTDLTTDFGDYRTEQEKRQDEQEKEKRGKEAVDLLSQMATTTVKTPEVAKIDYMFDIGGDSMFATPKQESLMPSPFEEAPEPVEGAMPRYQYYAPGGGYTYADGGIVEEYTIEDLYRMLGSK